MVAETDDATTPVRLSVVPALWPGETIAEIRSITRAATAAGCPEIWISEVNGYDAISLTAGLCAAGDTSAADVVVGPIALGVRDPALLAQGLASLRGYTERRIGVALGTSSRTIVEDWHGQTFANPVAAVEAYLPALKAASRGEKTDHSGPGWRSHGFKLNVPPPGRPHLTLAALGDRMLGAAGALADRVVVNLVTPELLARMKAVVDEGAAGAGRPPPPIAVWVLAGSSGYAGERAGAILPAYPKASGYRERLDEMAMSEILESEPRRAAAELGTFDLEILDDRLARFVEAGADEVALVMSGADPAAGQWIERLADAGWEAS